MKNLSKKALTFQGLSDDELVIFAKSHKLDLNNITQIKKGLRQELAECLRKRFGTNYTTQRLAGERFYILWEILREKYPSIEPLKRAERNNFVKKYSRYHAKTSRSHAQTPASKKKHKDTPPKAIKGEVKTPKPPEEFK